MEEKRNSVFLPGQIWSAVDEIARTRGCSRNELLVEQAQRYLTDREYVLRVLKLIIDLMEHLDKHGSIAGWSWPADPLEALMLGWKIADDVDQIIDQWIDDFDADELLYWEREVKRTGRDMTALLQDRMLHPNKDHESDSDGADWWKASESE
jgi:hypothetical protein